MIRTLLVVSIGFAIVGCQTTSPPNRGVSGRRMDPTHDSPAELGVRDLRSADLVTATDRMAQDLARWVHAQYGEARPRIYVGQIENRTSKPYQNYQVFLERLRGQLMVSGASQGLDFRRERQFVERERSREFGDKDPAKSAASYRSANEYVLTCLVHDLPSGGTDYYYLEYQLVQLVDVAETGSGEGAGQILWSNFYEVKFQ